MRRSATHSCEHLWLRSCHSLLSLLLLAMLGFLFISVALFSVTWVCFGHNSHVEVSKYCENRSLILFIRKFPVISPVGHHSTDMTPLWILSVIKRYLTLMCVCAFTAWRLAVIFQKNSFFIVLIDNILSKSIAMRIGSMSSVSQLQLFTIWWIS